MAVARLALQLEGKVKTAAEWRILLVLAWEE